MRSEFLKTGLFLVAAVVLVAAANWIDPGTATPEIPNFSDINFADINWAVAGFQGDVYPFAAPCDCPGQACP